MAEHERDFDLIQLDQQIEHPTGSLNAEARQLVEDLQQMGRPTQSEIRANEQSLQRVQRRLQARFKSAHQETTILPFRVSQTHQERNAFMYTPTSEHKPDRHRLSHTLDILAAALVVAALIGSAVTLFMLKNHMQSTRPNTTTGTRVQATAISLPKPDCSHVFTGYNGLYPDNGEQTVCLQDAETPLQGTATLAGHKLTLISAYADTNRLLIKYVESGLLYSRYDEVAYISHLLIEDPAQALTLAPDSWSIGGGSFYDQQKKQTAFLASFPTQQVAADTTALKVKVDFGAPVGVTQADPAGTNTDSASFTFSVPFHIQRRVATPNQSMVINGHQLTLTQVIITPSATALYVKTDEVLTVSPTSGMMEASPSVVINGNNNVSGAFTTNGIINGKWDPVTGFSLGAPEDWMNQPTTWTMTLQSSAPPLGEGTGTMQFTIPR